MPDPETPQDQPAEPEAPEAPEATGAPDASVLQKELAAARREAAKYRTEAKKLADAAQERDDAEKSELEKAQKRLQELEATAAEKDKALRETTLRSAAQTEALRLGYMRPERAWREVDLDAVEFDDDGTPKNLAKLLEAELAARPELKAQAPRVPDAGAGNRGKSSITLADIKTMSPEQINEKWDEVSEVLGQPGR